MAKPLRSWHLLRCCRSFPSGILGSSVSPFPICALQRCANEWQRASAPGRKVYGMVWPDPGGGHGQPPPPDLLITRVPNMYDLKTRGELVIFSFFRFVAALEHVPSQLNQGDSLRAKDERVYRH